jgi:hypothetical protein
MPKEPDKKLFVSNPPWPLVWPYAHWKGHYGERLDLNRVTYIGTTKTTSPGGDILYKHFYTCPRYIITCRCADLGDALGGNEYWEASAKTSLSRLNETTHLYRNGSFVRIKRQLSQAEQANKWLKTAEGKKFLKAAPYMG